MQARDIGSSQEPGAAPTAKTPRLPRRENGMTNLFSREPKEGSEMRIIKTLLVLLFLAPTLAAAEPNPESSFLRIQRDGSREPVTLQLSLIHI